METRNLAWYDEPSLAVEERSDAGPVITGHGIRFGVWSVDLGGFVERIHKDAADESLQADDVRVMSNHDSNLILGRKSAGTARFRKDNRGIVYEADRPDTTWARDLEVSIRRGDISGSSFGFVVLEAGDEWKRDGDLLKRTVKRMQVSEMGPQPFPAYPQSTTQARSEIARRGAQVVMEGSELEDWLGWRQELEARRLATLAISARYGF